MSDLSDLSVIIKLKPPKDLSSKSGM